jgi:hypothetical protein
MTDCQFRNFLHSHQLLIPPLLRGNFMDAPRNLPLGYADFKSIRADNCVFADKTRIIHELITKKTPYFLSRPRRFGKTLLVSVLKAIFEGRKDLFEGLWIYDKNTNGLPIR